MIFHTQFSLNHSFIGISNFNYSTSNETPLLLLSLITNALRTFQSIKTGEVCSLSESKIQSRLQIYRQ